MTPSELFNALHNARLCIFDDRTEQLYVWNSSESIDRYGYHAHGVYKISEGAFSKMPSTVEEAKQAIEKHIDTKESL